MEETKVRLLDSQFAKFLAGHSLLSGEEKRSFQDLVRVLSTKLAAGDSCYPLCPEEEDLVRRSGLCAEEGQPLIVYGGCLYVQRLFQYEKKLAEGIGKMAVESEILTADPAFLERLFAGQGREDLQRIAAQQALLKNFLIISGGPGTGKTSTVVKILALLRKSCESEKMLRIALAAPTGKAAVRLQESITGSVGKLPLAEKERQAFPVQASTLHRLLGVKRNSPFFRHNAERPLACDVLVVDEASMVDTSLMSKLVVALRPGSRLILLGDKNQLASVESGTVLADMMAALPENTVELQKSYRFDEGIKGFAEAVNGGRAKAAWQLLMAEEPAHISLLGEEPATYGGRVYCRYMQAVAGAQGKEDYKQLFAMLHDFRILCATRQGRYGVSGINDGVERFLTEKGYDCMRSEWYPGRPVIISRNQYDLDLYNGDMGICLPDPQSPGIVKVWFERADGSLQGILPGRIASCKTVYALTIHKSQGTEMAEVLVVLPGQESSLVTRELLYTAITRASRIVRVKADESVFRQAVRGRIRRHSGLVRLIHESRKRPPLHGGE